MESGFLILVQKVRFSFFEIFQNYFSLFVGIFSSALCNKLVFWNRPESRVLLTETMLNDYKLI